MKNYEALIIVNPRLTEEKVKALLSRVEKRITSNEGEVIKVNIKGIRRLAFTFSKHKKLKEGVFIEIEYKGIGKTTQGLIAFLRLQEEIIRHMVTIKEAPSSELEAEIVPEEQISVEAKPAAQGESDSGKPQ